jgi:hypothetical protein
MKRGGSPERASAHGTSPSEVVGPMTIALPAISLPAVTVQAAPPALITRRNAAHLGMSGDELVRVLRDMRADPRFRDAVIARGKSFRAAAPDAVIAFLRAAPAASTRDAGDQSEAETGIDDGVDMNLLRAAGYDLGPGNLKKGGKGRPAGSQDRSA